MGSTGRSAVSVLISVLQICSGVLLYRYRTLNHGWRAGDAIVLYGPPAIAFLLQIAIALSWRGTTKRSSFFQSGFIAALAVVLSFLATLIVDVNVYGS